VSHGENVINRVEVRLMSECADYLKCVGYISRVKVLIRAYNKLSVNLAREE